MHENFIPLKSSLELAAVGNPRGLFHSVYFIKLALSGDVELSQDDLHILHTTVAAQFNILYLF